MRLIIEFCKVNDNKIKLQVIRNILSKRYSSKSKNAFFEKPLSSRTEALKNN